MTTTRARLKKVPEAEQQILDCLAQGSGRMHWTHVRTRVHMLADEFKNATDALLKDGRIVKQPGPGNGYLALPGHVVKPEPRLSLLTTEVADRMQVTENTVRRWLREGIIRGVKPSGRVQGAYRIPLSEIERLQGTRESA